MTLSNPRRAPPSPSPPRPLRVLFATATLALAASLSPTAMAAPGGMMGGGPGGHGDHRGHGGHGGQDMAPQRLERMLDVVNATSEQRTQIKALANTLRTDMKAMHELGKRLHDQNRALFTQPTVDARAAEVLRQQMQARHEQASKRMLQFKLDMSRILTPDQRKQFADRMDKRKSMMERHRSEREALDQPKT